MSDIGTRRRKRLTIEEVLDIFRRAHAPGGELYRVIGNRHGVSEDAVAAIARGAVYKYLWIREDAPPDVPRDHRGWAEWDYTISEATGAGAVHRMRIGRRSRRGHR